MNELTHRQAICALANVAEKLALVEDRLWRVRAVLRVDRRPEATDVSEMLVQVLEATEMAHAVEYSAAREFATSAIQCAMERRQA